MRKPTSAELIKYANLVSVITWSLVALKTVDRIAKIERHLDVVAKNTRPAMFKTRKVTP